MLAETREEAVGDGSGAKPDVTLAPRRLWDLGRKLISRQKDLGVLIRYAMVSAAALAFDLAIFFSLMAADFAPAAVNGVIGYLAGGILHYVIAVHIVFDCRTTGKRHRRLITEYVLVGTVGVGLTAIVLFVLVNVLGAHPMLAKAVAVALSFSAVYLLRRYVVFRPRNEMERMG
ncbi:MAG: GtrA family protein [Pseudomonadota bacterium]